MLTDTDLQKIRKVVKEEVGSELDIKLFELKTEIAQAFAAKEEMWAHSKMLFDHEARLRFFEKYLRR